VPATTDADRAEIAAALGLEDAWPVVAEPFSQWVMEDRFPGGRPEFEAVGAELVGEVAPYELMKLRLLNGAHSALAYLGLLAGYDTVSDATADPMLSSFVASMMEGASATLTAPARAERRRYIQALLARFRNADLRHRLAQIAIDGSQKLPQRVLGVVRDSLRMNLPVDRQALVVAAWMRFVTRLDANGVPILVSDPLADRLAAIARTGGPDIVRALLSLRPIFGDDLPASAPFVDATTAAFAALAAGNPRQGVAQAVEWTNAKG
jgi:fructuronate reductase